MKSLYSSLLNIAVLTTILTLTALMSGCMTVAPEQVYPSLKCPANASEAFCKSYTRTTQIMILQGPL